MVIQCRRCVIPGSISEGASISSPMQVMLASGSVTLQLGERVTDAKPDTFAISEIIEAELSRYRDITARGFKLTRVTLAARQAVELIFTPALVAVP